MHKRIALIANDYCYFANRGIPPPLFFSFFFFFLLSLFFLLFRLWAHLTGSTDCLHVRGQCKTGANSHSTALRAT